MRYHFNIPAWLVKKECLIRENTVRLGKDTYNSAGTVYSVKRFTKSSSFQLFNDFRIELTFTMFKNAVYEKCGTKLKKSNLLTTETPNKLAKKNNNRLS